MVRLEFLLKWVLNSIDSDHDPQGRALAGLACASQAALEFKTSQ